MGHEQSGHHCLPAQDSAGHLAARSNNSLGLDLRSKGMIRFSFSGYAGLVVAIFLIAGCGSLGPQATIPRAASPALRQVGQHSKSWMLPEAKSKTCFTSPITRATKCVFSYPSDKLVGTLTGFGSPVGACVDKAGNVWIVNQDPPEVIEYAHGGSIPVATLSLDGDLYGCSIDPGTGNLAVVEDDYGITIFPNAQNPPTTFATPDLAQCNMVVMMIRATSSR
jgi:hypothetical protein